MRKLGFVVAAVAVLVAVPAAVQAGGGGNSAYCRGFTEGAAVSMVDSCFDGVAHFAAGPDLAVRNDGQAPHSFTAVDGSFDTGLLQAGEAMDLQVEPGIYRVFCTLHGNRSGEGMAGVLVVGAPALDAAVAAPIAPGPSPSDGEIVAALDRQTEVLSAIGDRQTALLDGLQPAAADAGPPDWAWQVTILLAVAAGAAVVALSAGRRPARPVPAQVVGEAS